MARRQSCPWRGDARVEHGGLLARLRRRQHLDASVAQNRGDVKRAAPSTLVYLCGLLGHEPLVASSGGELVELCRRERPDLVITDIKMADAVAGKLEVPVILLVSGHDGDLIRLAQLAHVMTYLVKPVELDQLAATVSAARTQFERLQAARKDAAPPR